MGRLENRKLTPLEYLRQLQKEYIATKVRLCIYDCEKDIQHYQAVLEQKRVDIDSLAVRNGFTKTVSNDIDKFNQYLSDFLQDGYPKFTYYVGKKTIFEKLDFIKYYKKGTWVVIDGKELGKVIYADFENKKVVVSVKIKNKIQKTSVEYKQVKRKNFEVCF